METPTNIRPSFLRLAVAVTLLASSVQTIAYNKVPITPYEFMRWPYYCQAAAHTGASPPPGISRPTVSAADQKDSGAFGIWHYCMALIHVQRAEVAATAQASSTEARLALPDLAYTWERIPKTHAWAADIAITYGRAYRIAGHPSRAMEYFDAALRSRPTYDRVYTAISLLHFDKRDYHQAIKVLSEGASRSAEPSAELNYFLGLAYAKAGMVDKARNYAAAAQKLGYPLNGIENAIRGYLASAGKPPDEPRATSE